MAAFYTNGVPFLIAFVGAVMAFGCLLLRRRRCWRRRASPCVQPRLPSVFLISRTERVAWGAVYDDLPLPFVMANGVVGTIVR